MRQLFFFLACMLVTGQCFSQNADSLMVVKQVDSLMAVNYKMNVAGKYQEALIFVQQAADVSKQKWGENNAKYAAAIHRLGYNYSSLGQLDIAEEYYLKAIDLRAKVLGKEHPDYANSISNLANLYKSKGDYAKAEPLFYLAKEIREKILGKEHPDYAASLNNLAIFYKLKGDFNKAEQFYLESLSIFGNAMGKNHPNYANILNNLAEIYSMMGDYTKAESLLLEAREIYANALGKEHPTYAQTSQNLAALYFTQGDFAQAEPLFLEAKELYAKTLGKEHPFYAITLENLANLYYSKGELAKAESMYLETKEIRLKTLGNDHPNYANSLTNLAILLSDKGDFAQAEPLYLEAKEILAKSLGKEHPSYVVNLENLAYLYWKTKRFSESATVFLETNKVHRHLIEQAATYSAENQMLTYIHTFDDKISQFQSFAQVYPNIELNKSSFENALFLNEFLLENVRNLSQAAARADSLTLLTYENWQACRRRLGNEYAKPIAERQYVTELEAQAEGFEKTLIRNLPAFAEARQVVHWHEAQDQLRLEEAAVEFIHYQLYNPKPTNRMMYAALILRPGWAAPKFIPLFEEKQLDALLQLKSGLKHDIINQLYGQTSLYKLLWQPLEKEMTGVKTVYFSPSGLLHRLNLGAISVTSTETLADRYQLVEMGSTRQLVVPSDTKTSNQDALLCGGIQYDMDSTAISQASLNVGEVGIATRGEVDFSYADSTLRGGKWGYLKWTDVEISSTEAILSDAGLHPIISSGYSATEESFKAIGKDKPSPRILHIATHGYFFPDPKTDAKGKNFRSGEEEPVFKISEHPMIRSGLILAGGNYAWEHGKPIKAGVEDGILTAYEISQMNLSNTELVVLSACETGLGDIQGNEGVYGLQRAFKIAGAKYLIMSLWQVPDFQTQELMTTFYSNWLEDKMTIPDAFRTAQKEMKKKYKDPFLWAGFVLVE